MRGRLRDRAARTTRTSSPVAHQVDALTEKHVAVVATHSVPEALAALVEYDPNASSPRTRRRCRPRSSACAPARSPRPCATPSVDGGQVREGDWIALVARRRRRDHRARRPTRCASCSAKLVDDDSEIVTVLVGCDAAANETERIREHIEVTFPHLEVEFHDGGQPLYPYLVGVE